MRPTTTLALVTSLAACHGTPAIRSTPPDAAATADPAFHVAYPAWHVVGDGVTPDEHTLSQLLVDAPAGTDFVDAWILKDGAPIDGVPAFRLDASTTPDQFGAVGIDLAPLATPGTYTLRLAADGAATAFGDYPLYRSAPYYVLVSTDWDFSDLGDQAMQYQDTLHQNHPGMRITNFVGPYTFTDPAVTPARQTTIASWVLGQASTYQDEIGLHIHPYCNFVTDAGLPCITDQSTVYANGDTSGYTIKVGAYGRDDFATLLDHAHALFAQHGLPRPKTFRAGGWTATLDTLAALDSRGYVADTSALNWPYIKVWQHQGSGELYTWNMMQWSTIDDTSQPYHPSTTDIQSPGTMALLEVPDNGVMIDYTTLAQIEHIFDANFPDGKPLATSTTMMMGYHPATGFTLEEFQRVDAFLGYADAHLANRNLGPVVYITLSDVVPAFPLH